jgi:hypothetical protein
MVIVESTRTPKEAEEESSSAASDFDAGTATNHYDQVRVSHFILLMVLDGMLFLPHNLAKLGHGRWGIYRTMKRLIKQGIIDPSGNKFSENTIAILREYISKGKRFVDPRGLAEFAFDVYRMESWTDEDIANFVRRFADSLNKSRNKKIASPEEQALLKKFRNYNTA